MLSFGNVRRWQHEPLDAAERRLRAHSHTLVGLADELAQTARPPGWQGRAADAAAHRHGQLADRMEQLVAGLGAGRTAVMQAADQVMELRNLVAELEALARAWGFTVGEAGAVLDSGSGSWPEAVRQQRESVRAELVERVRVVLATAEELDAALASTLGRLGSEASTRDTGDGRPSDGQPGDGQPGPMALPGPPSPPPTDPGAGPHGVEPWYGRADDHALHGLVAAATVAAEAGGWTFAARHLRHYLGNSGETLRVDPDLILRDADQFRAQVDRTVAQEMRRLAAQAEADGSYGTPVQFQTPWRGHYIGPEESQDWFYAMGGVQYAVGGVATVYPPEQPGGQPRIELDYQTHVFDRYNWDGGKSTEIGPVTVTDEQLAALHRAGVAQEYDLSGSGQTRHLDLVVPLPGQQPALSGPFDERTGTRTDSRR